MIEAVTSDSFGFQVGKFVELKFPAGVTDEVREAVDVLDINNESGLFVAGNGCHFMVERVEALHSLIDGDEDDEEVLEFVTKHVVTLDADIKFLKLFKEMLLIGAEDKIIIKQNSDGTADSFVDLSKNIDIVNVDCQEMVALKVLPDEKKVAVVGTDKSLYMVTLSSKTSEKIYDNITTFEWCSTDTNIVYIATNNTVIVYDLSAKSIKLTVPDIHPVSLTELDSSHLVAFDTSSYMINLQSKQVVSIDEEFCANDTDIERNFINYNIKFHNWAKENNLLLVSSSIGSYISILTADKVIVPLEDDQRAAVPMDPRTYDDLYISGMAVDLLYQNKAFSLPNFEDPVADLPYVWLLTTTGLLVGYSFFDTSAIKQGQKYPHASYQKLQMEGLKTDNPFKSKSSKSPFEGVSFGSLSLDNNKSDGESNDKSNEKEISNTEVKSPFGNVKNDSPFGNVKNDSPFGNVKNDSPFGNVKNDSLFGNVKNDSPFGNVKNDSPFGNVKNDSPFGNVKNDSPFGNVNNTSLFGNVKNESPFGNASNSSPFDNIKKNSPLGSFGQSDSKPTFGSLTFGKSFNQDKPAFGTSSFGSDKPAFGTSSFGSDKPAFGASSFGSDKPAFGTSSFGSDKPAFGASSFGSDKPAFGTSSFGSDKSAFGASSFGSDKPAFGQITSKPAFTSGFSSFSNTSSPLSSLAKLTNNKGSLFGDSTSSGKQSGLFSVPSQHSDLFSSKQNGNIESESDASDNESQETASGDEDNNVYKNGVSSQTDTLFGSDSYSKSLENESDGVSEVSEESDGGQEFVNDKPEGGNDDVSTIDEKFVKGAGISTEEESLSNTDKETSNNTYEESINSTHKESVDNTNKDHINGEQSDNDETATQDVDAADGFEKKPPAFGDFKDGSKESNDSSLITDDSNSINSDDDKSDPNPISPEKDNSEYVNISVSASKDYKVSSADTKKPVYHDKLVEATKIYKDAAIEEPIKDYKDEELLTFEGDEEYIQSLRISMCSPKLFKLDKIIYPKSVHSLNPIMSHLEKMYYGSEAEYEILQHYQNSTADFLKDHLQMKNLPNHRLTSLKNIYTWRLAETPVITDIIDNQYVPQAETLSSMLSDMHHKIKQFRSDQFHSFLADYDQFVKDYEAVEVNQKLINKSNSQLRSLPLEFSLVQQKIKTKFNTAMKLFEELETKMLILKSKYEVCFHNKSLSAAAKTALFNRFQGIVRSIKTSIQLQMKGIFILLKDMSEFRSYQESSRQLLYENTDSLSETLSNKLTLTETPKNTRADINDLNSQLDVKDHVLGSFKELDMQKSTVTFNL